MGSIPPKEEDVPVDIGGRDVMFFRNNMLNRFNLEKEKMIGEAYQSEAVMISTLENAMLLAMRRSLELLYRRYPDLYKHFDFTKAGFDIRFDAEHNSLSAGFNRVLNDILLWVEKNSDKLWVEENYKDPIFKK